MLPFLPGLSLFPGIVPKCQPPFFLLMRKAPFLRPSSSKMDLPFHCTEPPSSLSSQAAEGSGGCYCIF